MRCGDNCIIQNFLWALFCFVLFCFVLSLVPTPAHTFNTDRYTGNTPVPLAAASRICLLGVNSPVCGSQRCRWQSKHKQKLCHVHWEASTSNRAVRVNNFLLYSLRFFTLRYIKSFYFLLEKGIKNVNKGFGPWVNSGLGFKSRKMNSITSPQVL